MVPSNPIKIVLVFLVIFFPFKTIRDPLTNIIHLRKEIIPEPINHLNLVPISLHINLVATLFLLTNSSS
jgi:hypothetical protein